MPPLRRCLTLASALAALSVSSILAQAPADPAAPDAEQLVAQLADRCRPWLVQPGPDLRSLKYSYHLGGDVREVKLAAGVSRVGRALWQGASLYTGLHALAAAPDKFDVTAARIETDAAYATPFIRLTVRPKNPDEPLHLAVGNGIEGTWRGYYSHSSDEMRLDLDATTLLPLRERHEHSQYDYRDWQEVRPGQWAPQEIAATRGASQYRMRFAWLGDAVWLLTEAEIVDGDRVTPVARTSDVQVNDAETLATLTAEQERLDAARQVVRDMLARNAAWLAPAPSFDTLQYTFHAERQDVTEACAVRRNGLIAMEIVGDGQGKMGDSFGARKILLPDGRYGTARRGDARAMLHASGRDRNEPDYAAQLRRYALIGCQFDLPLFGLGDVLDDAFVEIEDGAWNGVPCHVATIRPTRRGGPLGCGVMLGFTSWSYVHHISPAYEVVYIDKERLVPVHETLVSSRDDLRFEIDFADYAPAGDAADRLAPLRIEITSPDYFTCRYEFQLLADRHWLLRTVESWFKPDEVSRGTIADVRIDEPAPRADEAQRQVDAYRAIFEESAVDADAGEHATVAATALPFVLGHAARIGQADVVFTLDHRQQLILRCTADDGVEPSQAVSVALLDDADRLLQAGHAEFAPAEGRSVATVVLGPSYALAAAKRFVIGGLGETSSLAGAETRTLRAFPLPATGEPVDWRGVADESGKTRLVAASRRRSNAGDDAVTLHFASRDQMNEFEFDVCVAAFDPQGQLMAAAGKSGRLRVESEIVDDAWELSLPKTVQQIEAVAIGLARGHTTSAPMGSLWGMFLDRPNPFPIDARLGAADPGCWPSALADLDSILEEALDDGLLGRNDEWRDQVAEKTTPADQLRPYVDRLLEIAEVADANATLAAAIRLLGFAEDDRVVPRAIALLAHDDSNMRENAAIALGLLRRDEGLSGIDSILAADEPQPGEKPSRNAYRRRRDALIALATVRSDASLPLVEKWMRAFVDGNPHFAEQFAMLLGRLQDPRYLPILADALDRLEQRHPDGDADNGELLAAILSYGSAARDVIGPRIRRGDARALYALKGSRDEFYIDAVRAMLDADPDADVLRGAVGYLSNIGSPAAIDVLRQAYDRGLPAGDDGESTRLRLAAALAAQGDVRGLPEAFDVLVELAGVNDPPVDEKEKKQWQRRLDNRRDDALSVFKRSPTAAVDEFLAFRADDADEAARTAVLQVLDTMRALPADVRPHLQQWANDVNHPELAQHATSLLIRHK